MGAGGAGGGAGGSGANVLQSLTQMFAGLVGNNGGLASNPGDYVSSNEALESLMTQLLQAGGGASGAPPVTKSVMETLAAVEVTEENVTQLQESDCAVCKDAFEQGETYHQLPCNHYFHCDCIRPWLEMVRCCCLFFFSIF